MRRFLPLAAACLLLGSVTIVACSGGSDTPEWEGETIKIGSIFSTSGDGIDYGPQQLRAARLAIDQVNSDGGGVNGAKLKLVQRNDASDPARSKEAMGNLIRAGKVMAVMGPTFSNSAVEADPLADQLETTVLAVSNTAPGIVGDCPYPCRFVFRDSLGEAEAIPANIAAASGVSGETAAIVYPSGDPFGATTAGIARDAFRKEGVRVTAMTTSPAGLSTAIGGKPDLLMITASSGDLAAQLIRQSRELGFGGVILGGNAFNSAATSRAAGPDGRGAQSAAAWFQGNTSGENREFIQDYRTAYGEDPDQFAAQAYTGVLILAAAAEDADLGFTDLAADRKALRDAMEKVDIQTPLGPFSFNEDQDVSQPIWIVEMNGKGGFGLVREVQPSSN
ncbi:MAG: hypothetical protein FGM38_07185 [Solirubrobacterales bacterium]|nr:hypothetical protein [Solirubrobacterales bacterium]